MEPLTKAFRLNVETGATCPCTRMTNAHGPDKRFVIITAPVFMAIEAGKRGKPGGVDWKDVVRCVLAHKNPEILLTAPEAAKPRKELEEAPPDTAEELVGAVEGPPVSPKSEIELALEENRAPDPMKLTDAELNDFAKAYGIDPDKYTTSKGLARAVQKAMEAAGK